MSAHFAVSSHYQDEGLLIRGSRRFFQKGSNFFLVNEWIQIPLKSGHHRPTSETPSGGPMMALTLNAGLVAL